MIPRYLFWRLSYKESQHDFADDAIDLIPKSLIRKITSVELISESNNRAYKLLSDKREHFSIDGPSAKHLGMDRERGRCKNCWMLDLLLKFYLRIMKVAPF